MFPDSPFATAVGSFQSAVLPPSVDPDATPTKSFDISCEWLPFIRGALQQLVLQSTWKTDDPAVLLLAQQRAMTLIAMFEECTTLIVPFECFGDFSETANPFATWAVHCNGVWNDVLAYTETYVECTPGTWYNGIFLQVDFDNPITVTDIDLTYDMGCGAAPDPSDPSGVHLFDVTNSADIGTPILMGDCSSGLGLHYHTGAYTNPFSTLWIIIEAGRANNDHSATGSCRLGGIHITGLASVPPC